MKQTNIQIIHNIVRYPVIIISLPIQCVALSLKYFSDGLNTISVLWGKFLIKKFMKQ